MLFYLILIKRDFW